MNTLDFILSRYKSPLIPLALITEEFLKIKKETANKLANEGKLSLPLFKLHDSIQSPWLIHAEDLANEIDRRRANTITNLTKNTGNNWLNKPLIKPKKSESNDKENPTNDD